MPIFELTYKKPHDTKLGTYIHIYLKEKTGLFRRHNIGHAYLRINPKDNETTIILDDFRLEESDGSSNWGYGYGKTIISFMKSVILKLYGEKEFTITVNPSSVAKGQSTAELYLKYLGVGFHFRDIKYSRDNLPISLNEEMYMVIERHMPSQIQ